MTRPSPKRVRELLSYEPDTGVVRWKSDRRGGKKAGEVAGCASEDRWVIGLDNTLYMAHILIWVIVVGEWPKGVIDHWDTNPSNNKWGNLRDVSSAVNSQNMRRARPQNRAGLLGVSRHPNGRFRSTIVLRGKQTHLGYYTTAQEAHEAYIAEKRRIHEGCTL